MDRDTFIAALERTLAGLPRGAVRVPTARYWCWAAALADRLPQMIFKLDLSMAETGPAFAIDPDSM